MSYITSQKTNIEQNSSDFILPANKNSLFKRGLLKKELNPPQEDPTKPRTVTVYCTYKGCK